MRRFVSVSPPGGRPEGNLVPSQMGKAPARRTASGGWMGYNWLAASQPSIEEVTRWVDEGSNLGIVADRFPALDIDSLDADFVQHVVKRAEARLGDAPQRVGKAPKTLLVYHCGTDTPKRTLHVEAPDGKRHLVEWLGAKQQYLIFGTHPSGSPYTWVKPIENPLTFVTNEQVGDFFASLAEDLPQGWKVVGRSSGGDAKEVEAEKLLAPSIDALRELMSDLPNKADREDWVRVALAIKGACGDHDDDGFSIFLEWSNRWDGGHNDEGEVRRTWRSLHSKQLGWEYLEAFSRNSGEAPAAEDLFDADDGDGEGEDVFTNRLVRLVGAERVFLRELRGELRGQPLRERLEEYKIAEGRTTPPERLLPVLPKVLAVVERRSLMFPVTDEDRTRRLLRQDLSTRKMSQVDKDLLEEAVLLMLMDRSVIAQRGKLVPVRPDKGRVKWLVDSMMPRTGVVSLVGAPGQGKTHIACYLSHRVASEVEQDPFGGPDIPPQFCAHDVLDGSVIYFAGEDAMGVAERLQRMGADLDKIKVFDHVPNFSSFTDTAKDVTDAMESLSGKPPVRLLVVDMLFHAMTGDENTVEALRPALKTAEAMSRLWDCTVLFLHHPSKAETELTALRPRGSSAFEGAIDWWAAVGNMAHEGKNGDRRIVMLERKNKHAGMHMEGFRFHLDDGILSEGDLPREEEVSPEMMGRALNRVLLEVDPQDRGLTDRTLKLETKRLYPQWAQNYSLFHDRYVRGRVWALDNGWIEWYNGTKLKSTHKET